MPLRSPFVAPSLLRGRAFAASAAAVLSLGLVHCSSDSTADEEDLSAVKPSTAELAGCQSSKVQKTATGETVVECLQPFQEQPFIRPPADSLTGSSVKLYAGVSLPSDSTNAFVIWTRDGKRFVPVDSAGKAIPFTASTKLPKALHAPSNRETFTIYQFTGTVGTSITSAYGSAKKIHLTGARAVYDIPGCVFDGHLIGTWEGTASERLSTPEGSGAWAKAFDDSKRVPLRITFDSGKQQLSSFLDYDGKKKVTDQKTFMLEGTIENFDKDVTADDGTKFPSLTAMGTQNPFYGAAKGDVELYRLGNMHGTPGDGHWVLTYPAGSQNLTGNGMTFTLTAQTAPSYLFDASVAADELESLDVRPHIPYTSNGHTVEIHPAAPNGESGLCPN